MLLYDIEHLGGANNQPQNSMISAASRTLTRLSHAAPHGPEARMVKTTRRGVAKNSLRKTHTPSIDQNIRAASIVARHGVWRKLM